MNELNFVSVILKELLCNALLYSSDVSNLEPLFLMCKPSLSFILSISHCFCQNCCELYTPCHVSEFISTNPELYDSEINFFSNLIETFQDYIIIDIEPYSKEEYFTFKRISFITENEKLKQLYTVILYS